MSRLALHQRECQHVSITNSGRTEHRDARNSNEEGYVKRSGQFGIIADSLQAVGGTAAALQAMKVARDIAVAKINANKDVTVARIENDRPEHGGGKHRSE